MQRKVGLSEPFGHLIQAEEFVWPQKRFALIVPSAKEARLSPCLFSVLTVGPWIGKVHCSYLKWYNVSDTEKYLGCLNAAK